MLLIAAVVAGCSSTTRYKVKTFFFTGVPEPGKQQVERPQAEIDIQVATKNTRRRQGVLPPVPYFMHGPFAAGRCESCHATTESKPFRTGMDKPSDSRAKRTVNIGDRLAYTEETLCISCHSEKSQAAADARGLWLHGPVASGWCTQCHSPHKSPRQYLLLKPNIELCTQCHTTADLQITLEHQQNPAVDCVSCHNPHMGLSAMLLKTEYDELQRFN